MSKLIKNTFTALSIVILAACGGGGGSSYAGGCSPSSTNLFLSEIEFEWIQIFFLKRRTLKQNNYFQI